MLDAKEALSRLAKNVRQFAAMRGLSQSDLARAIGENRVNISRIFNGVHVPNAVTLANLAEALGVSVDQLLAEPVKKFANSA